MPDRNTWCTQHRTLALGAIFLVSLAVRLATAEYIDIGGDNAWRWMEVHRLLAGLPISQWTHQTIRWPINLPLWGLMKIFGPHPAVYPILPVAMASLAAVLLCLIGERLHSLKLGLATSLLYICCPIMAQTGSQMWPSVFHLAFISLSVWLLLVWLDKNGSFLLVLAGVGFFLAWGSNVSAIYFIPGLLLLVWWPSRSVRALATFCGTIAVCCIGEWIMFWALTGNRLGVFGLVGSTHGHQEELLTSLRNYLLNFLNFKKLRGMLPVMLLSLYVCIPMLRSQDRRRQALAGLYLSFVLMLTYMVASLSPLRLSLPFGTRYWAAGAPFGLLLILLWLSDHRKAHPRLVKGCLALLFAAFLLFSAKLIPPTNSVVQMSRDYELLAPALETKSPVLMHYDPWEPDLAEKLLMRWFMGSSKPRHENLEQMTWNMERNRRRILALFLRDVSRFDEYSETPLQRLSDYEYLLVPPGAPEQTPPTVEVRFGRKLCRAIPLR